MSGNVKKTHRIVIDITSLMEVTYVSGIQRVVREILMRFVLKENRDYKLVLIAYQSKKQAYIEVSSQKFLACYQKNTISVHKLWKSNIFLFDKLTQGDLFFDIDSVWNNRIKRSFLLPRLKVQNIKIVTHIYDLIPVFYPQYCDSLTSWRFIDYLGAHCMHSDLIIANTQSTLDDLKNFICEIDSPEIPCVSIPLGSDFSGKEANLTVIDPRAKLLEGKKFLLAVGTIEPRKNYDFLISAYESSLRALGFYLVIAGRPGWNVESLMDTMETLYKKDSHFLYFSSANDDTIRFLYENAFFTIFPSHYEGFGLPIIESIVNKTPVMVSDIPVLREVGLDYADYFAFNSAKELTKKLKFYLQKPKKYLQKKSSLEKYSYTTWDETADAMWEQLTLLLEKNTADETNTV